MKRLTINFVFFLLIFQICMAQVKDSKGHLINSKGDIYFEGVQVGKVVNGKDVVDRNGKKLAHLDENGVFKDSDGRMMGKVGKDGSSFFSSEHVLSITVKDLPGETCDILNADGKVIGNIHDSYKGMACAIHCFQQKMKTKSDGSHMKH